MFSAFAWPKKQNGSTGYSASDEGMRKGHVYYLFRES